MDSNSVSPKPVRFGTVLYAFVADLVLIVIFAAIGRASHQEESPIVNVLSTAWPFLVGAALSWIVGRVWRAPLRLWPHGVCLWLITLIAGILLRLVSGRTAEFSFIVVAAIVLAVFLLGHRVIVTVIANRKSRHQEAA
ncbi:putative integral membrane protein [Renibacterium salmoninarum ATCC 33209]|uniref:Putative integral membrane protein n=1 Tax=Renibacterium salmoninarum (strain ATCC 33209 / DSM 20767 / JCM 11484 / NBRC 15589 / NCIMB 2235) TaxID=288705 RepID=A9WR03_RENSM|nr:DUF3054 domain-containing protein [Renibacterium salmoninarum]ABY23309.1 putative integral membrane protein [Renibacterium salmoninarum ATCC 33209]